MHLVRQNFAWKGHTILGSSSDLTFPIHLSMQLVWHMWELPDFQICVSDHKEMTPALSMTKFGRVVHAMDAILSAKFPLIW